MINLIVTLSLIILFMLSGQVIPGFRRIVQFISDEILFILRKLGFKVHRRERTLLISNSLKECYKDIKTMKISKTNLKGKSSVNWLYVILLIISVSLVIINLGVISDNILSRWLYSKVFFLPIIQSEVDMNTLFTATIFSLISFSLTKIVDRWKETKEQRIEARKRKQHYKALREMSSAELLIAAREKDKQNLSKASGKSEDK